MGIRESQAVHHLINALSFGALQNFIILVRGSREPESTHFDVIDDVICLPVLDSVQRIAVHIGRKSAPNVPICEDLLRDLLPNAASRRPRNVFIPLSFEYVYDIIFVHSS